MSYVHMNAADPLEALLAEVAPSEGATLSPAPPSAAPPTDNILKRGLNYSHDSLIDLIIAHPGISQNTLAAIIGYSASWISQVMSSDAFQARLAERRSELVDPTLIATVEEQFKGVVARSLEIIKAKLAKPPDQIPDNLALRSLEVSSRALGYGARDPAAPPVLPGDVNIHLNILGERLVGLLAQKRAEALPRQLENFDADEEP